MPVSAGLRRDLLNLPPAERQELADELYESLADDVDPEWEAAWSKQIEARIADAEKHPSSLIDAREMIRELRAERSAKPR